MWRTLRISRQTDTEFVALATELLQSTTRILIITTGCIYLLWHIMATVLWPDQFNVNAWLVTTIIALTCFLALRALSKQLQVAQVIWQTGFAAAITLALYLFQRSEIAFLYALLPLMATVTMTWTVGLLAEGLVIILVWWLSHGSLTPPLPMGYALAIAAGGVITGVFGWVAIHALLTVTQWSLFSYEQARRKMEEARDRLMELKQIRADLLQANQELARLSDRLKVMYQVAEEARRAKEEFVANVSHELRTPLNMIIGFSEMIINSPQVYGGNLPPALLSDIAAIHLNSQHLAKLVDDVLDLSQVEAGRMALSKEWTSLQEIIEEAIPMVQPLFESKGLYLEAEVHPDLPPIFCDSTRIRQVVLNLLSNAGRFTERGGVQVKAWRKGNKVMVSVSDTGPGIAPQDQEKIFEPFRQLDGSIRRRHGGSGLGLSISKRFVEMHEGKMWLESAVGIGTTFYFSLPLDTPLPTALASAKDARRWFSPYLQYETRTRRSKAPAPQITPRYVLLEKGEALQRLFNRYLQGAETIRVENMQEAIGELRRSPARALVVNASPFEETPNLLDRLSELPYGTPAVTCWVPGADEAARRLGVVRYLVKPVTRQALLSTLEDLGNGVKSVLVVDDEPDALQLFARMLSSASDNYRLLQATNGQRALALLRQRHPDVMLLDLIMPGMDGFQVLREKSQDRAIRDIPVVIISARDPVGEPIVSNTLTTMRSGGLSVRDLLACIQAVSEILSPSRKPVDRGQPENRAE